MVTEKKNENQADEMYYAIKYGDNSANLLFLQGGCLFFAYVVMMAYNIKQWTHFAFFFHNLHVQILTVIIATLIGVLLGYAQSVIRVHDIVNNAPKLAKLQKTSSTFIGKISTAYSYWHTNTLRFNTLVLILLITLWFISVLRFNTLEFNFVLLTGCVYAWTDYIIWKCYFKKKIYHTSDIETYLDLDEN